MLEYELYQGEEFLGEGTAADLSERLGINKRSIYQFSSDEFHNRADERSNQKIAFVKNPKKIKQEKIKSALEERLDLIVKLYFNGYELKTILKTIKEL